MKKDHQLQMKLKSLIHYSSFDPLFTLVKKRANVTVNWASKTSGRFSIDFILLTYQLILHILNYKRNGSLSCLYPINK
jgi:hypothetical protein